ncbi:MAG TPA: NERD domain-containing protein [Chloroflexia bacterium]|nr:NERD domain-containing protein [Chloroflexia bacterium]
MLLSISNKAEVQREIRLNRILFWLGVACLLSSMLVLFVSAGLPSLASLVFLIGYPALIIGLLLSKRGAYTNRRHGVGGYKIAPESDMLAEELSSLPARYHLYNWIKLDDLSVDHLLMTPQGAMIILARAQQGDIKAGHDRYRRKIGLTGWFSTLGEPGVGNPSLELANQVKKLRAWFEKKGYEIPVDGVVVFTNPRTKILTAEEMSFPVCHLHELKTAVRGWETELNMTTGEQQEVEDQIINALPAESAEEARTLIQMPGFKRDAYLKAQRAASGKDKEKEVAPKAPEKPKKEEAPKPKLTPEERERLRLERIKAAQEKGRQPANPYQPLDPGKKMGINGKVREERPAVIEKKLPKRRVEPLRRPTPGAFGDYSGNEKKQ